MALPVFHAAAVPLAHASSLRDGGQTYIMRRFDVQQYLTAVKRYHITDINLVPSMIFAALKHPLATQDTLQSLRDVVTGGAPMDKKSQNSFQQLLPLEATLTQVLGHDRFRCYADSMARKRQYRQRWISAQ